ncbi:hypothetical protein AAG570_001668 [Ranatra chinensis]|uniref:Uncharacterized protein n=1 Tax=Ranatra chinensis TaxID=642074 RepID=A0ABD0YRS5_9HEMI
MDTSLERVYGAYSVKQKRAALCCLLAASALYDVHAVGAPPGALLLGGNLALWAASRWASPRLARRLWPILPHLAWHLALLQLLAHLFLQTNEVTARESLGWALLLDYLVYVTLPLRLRYCVMLSLGTCASYLVSLVGLAKSDAHLTQQVTLAFLTYSREPSSFPNTVESRDNLWVSDPHFFIRGKDMWAGFPNPIRINFFYRRTWNNYILK